MPRGPETLPDRPSQTCPRTINAAASLPIGRAHQRDASVCGCDITHPPDACTPGAGAPSRPNSSISYRMNEICQWRLRCTCRPAKSAGECGPPDASTGGWLRRRPAGRLSTAQPGRMSGLPGALPWSRIGTRCFPDVPRTNKCKSERADRTRASSVPVTTASRQVRQRTRDKDMGTDET